MASEKKPRSRDMVLESRHLLGMFFLIVVLCTIFFSLGYVMRGARLDTSVSAAPPPLEPPKEILPSTPQQNDSTQPQSALPGPSDWDFYKSTEAKKAPDRLEPAKPKPALGTKTVTTKPAPQPARPRYTSPSYSADAKKLITPNVPKGSIVLQVAALSRSTDALALADSLQKKGHRAYVLSPAGDSLYRVQVGPFSDTKKAEAAKKALEAQGFKSILRK